MTDSSARRVAVVMITDIVDSTGLGERHGQSALHRAVGALRAAAQRAAGLHGGREIRHLGDGFVHEFGSATGAVEAGVYIQQLLEGAVTRGEVVSDLRVRIGVAAGDVVDQPDGTSLGRAYMVAERLQAGARPGGILCSPEIAAMATELTALEIVDAGEVETKDKETNLRACRVTVPPPSAAELLGMPPALDAVQRFAWIARPKEWGLLDAAWGGAAEGMRWLVLAGEPGVGKTRLGREFAEHVRSTRGVVLYGRCDENVRSPFQPAIEWIRYYLECVPADRRTLGDGSADLGRLIPELGTGPAAGWEGVDEDTERHHLFEAVASWLRSVSEEAPVLVVVDDLMWADEPTLALLDHLGRTLRDAAVCGLGLTRPLVASQNASSGGSWPVGSAPNLHGFLESARLERLGGLDDVSGLKLAEAVIDGKLDPSAIEPVRQLGRSVGGNPLILGELVRSLVRARKLQPGSDGRWSAVVPLQVEDTPPAVDKLINDRVRGLSPATRRTLEWASVVGMELEADVVGRVAGIHQPQLRGCLAEGANAQLIQSKSLHGHRYEFSHAVVRDAILNRVTDQRAAHHRIAEALEELRGQQVDLYLEQLAYHYSEGIGPADMRKAIWYLRRAAARAERQLAFSVAVEHLQHAVELLNAHGAEDEVERCGLLITLGRAERRAGSPEAKEHLREAASLALRKDDGIRAADAILAEGRRTFSRAGAIVQERVDRLVRADQLLAGDDSDPDRLWRRALLKANLAEEHTFAEDLAEPKRFSDEATALAEHAGNPRIQVAVASSRMVALWRPETVADRRSIGEGAIDICRTELPHRKDLLLDVLTGCCQACMEQGDFVRADELLSQIAGIARELRQPTVVGYAKLRLSNRECAAGRFAEAEQLAAEAFRFAESAGQPDAREFYAGNMFTIRLHQGRLGEMVADVEEMVKRNPGIAAFAAAAAVCRAQANDKEGCRQHLEALAGMLDGLREDLNWLPCLALAVLACSYVQDGALAGRIGAKLRPHADLFVDNASTFFGSVKLYLGLAELAQGNDEAAAPRLRRALDAHRRLPSPPLIARTEVELARALIRCGDHHREVTELLTDAHAAAARLGMREVFDMSMELLATQREVG